MSKLNLFVLTKDPSFDLYNMKSFWMKTLEQKFSKKIFNDLLKSTKDNYLVEFSKSAKRENSFWTGLIEDGILYGQNTMGKYLMEIRRH